MAKHIGMALMVFSGALVIGCFGAAIWMGGIWAFYYLLLALINSFTFYSAYGSYVYAVRTEAKDRHPSSLGRYAHAEVDKKNPVGFIW